MKTIARQKKICWTVLIGALGCVAMICALIIQDPPPLRVWGLVYGWLGVSLVAGIVSAALLKIYYRLEPFQGKGFWHLRLTDFFVSTLVASLFMGLWNTLWPSTFLYWGATVSVVAGVAFAFSLLTATRKGYVKSSPKIAYAAGIFLKSYGKLALLGLIGLSVLPMLIHGPARAFGIVLRTLIGPSAFEKEAWIGAAVWLGIVALGLGWMICRIVDDFFAPVEK